MAPVDAEPRASAEAIRAALSSALLPRGFDLTAPLNLRHYNAGVPASCRIGDSRREDALVIVVASSRAIWPVFLDALRARPELLDQPHPFDTFCMEGIRAAADELPVRTSVRWSHDPPPRRIAIQRAAHLAGLARLGRTHLCIHPVHGPWIGLRAMVVCDVPGPPAPAIELPDLCADCEARCEPALQVAVAASRADGDLASTPRTSWKLWVALRDSCPVGRDSRYFEDQIQYHYTKDKDVLRALVVR